MESPFVPGSIVWARMGGYPWYIIRMLHASFSVIVYTRILGPRWPAMVEEDPDEETYYEMSDSFCTIPVSVCKLAMHAPVYTILC